MKKSLFFLLTCILIIGSVSSVFAIQVESPVEEFGIEMKEFNEFGIRSGVDIIPEYQMDGIGTLAAEEWETLPTKKQVSLNKEWTIEFNRTFTIKDIDGIVIEGNGLFVPVRIRLFPTAKEIKVLPAEKYLPNERYTLKVFLNNGKRYKIEFDTKDQETYSEKFGNTSGNISNGGIVTEKGEWIYYANSSDGNKLYKVKKDGTGKVKLCDDAAISINVVGGWVYYVKSSSTSQSGRLHRIRTDGTDKNNFDKVVFNINVSDDGWIYDIYIGGYLNRRNHDGSNSSSLVSGVIFKNLVATDGYLYATTTSSMLYKYDISAKTITKFLDERVSHINILDGWIYYINIDDGNLYKVDESGHGKLKITSTRCESLNVDNGWAYYVNEEDRSIYRIRLDGTQNQRLNDSPSTNINIIEDWIYYENPTTNEFYRMHLNGSSWGKVD